MRLRYHGTASRWGFALHDPASDRYQDALLLTGSGSGTPARTMASLLVV